MPDLNEQRIKDLLTRHIKQNGWRRTDALIPEYFVERASRRADLVAVNGHLTAYEIKSDLDHLNRLTGQLEVYSKHFEAVTVVCTQKHLNSVLQLTDSTVGIMCVSIASGVQQVREPTLQDVEIAAWLSHLPIAAIRDALAVRGIRCPRVDRTEVLKVAHKHMSSLDVRTAVLTYLRTEKRKQRIALAHKAPTKSRSDPLEEHRAMLRDYLNSRSIATC